MPTINKFRNKKKKGELKSITVSKDKVANICFPIQDKSQIVPNVKDKNSIKINGWKFY